MSALQSPHYLADFRIYRTCLDERYPAPAIPEDATPEQWDAAINHYRWIDETAARLSAVSRLADRSRPCWREETPSRSRARVANTPPPYTPELRAHNAEKI